MGSFTTADPDRGDTHTYRLASGAGDADNGSFRVNGSKLETDTALDHEAKPSYSVRVRATDNKGGTFEKAFAITVTNVNDSPTNISLSPSSVDENKPPATEVGTLATTDQDAGDTHTHSLVAGTGDADNGSFQITGDKLKTSAAFDFEAKASYSIRVRTDDGNGGTFEKSLTIDVDDANEPPTDISLSSSSVAENKPPGTEVGTFTTSDPEAGDAHTYSLASGAGDDDNGSFRVNGSKLETDASLDFEQKSSFSIRVETDDGDGGTFEKALTVTVTNANEPPTDISLSSSSVAENKPPGTEVGTLSTGDPDAGDTHTYSLASGTGDDDNGSFRINGSKLETDASLDFEQKSSYSIRVETDDGNGGTFEKALTVTVTNANDPPTDISLSSANVDENKPSGTTVGTLSTSDQDAGDTHTYSLVAGAGDDDNASFQITGSTLETKVVLDHEQDPTRSVRVRVDDGNGETFEKTVTVDVNDVNDPATDIALSSSSVDENEPADTTVGMLLTSDQDAGASHTYTLVAGAGDADNASFQITGSTLETNAAFDFEAKSSYSIRVRTDDGNGGTFEKPLTVTVNNVNEPPSDISLSPSSVAENEPVGTDVGTLSTTDQDSGDTHTYSLASGTGDADNGSFQITGDKLKTNAAFNFEAKASYSIRLRSTDSGNASTEKELTVTIVDANDAPTNISLSPSSVDENKPAGTDVGTLSTTDQDSGDTHTYSLASGTGDADNGSFQITGDKLKTNAAFNFEVKSSYSIRVRSTDSGNASTEKELTVTIVDVNDPPVANGDSYSGAIGNTKAQLQTTSSGPVVTLTGNVITQNDTDEDAGDSSLSAVAETVTSTGGGTATIGSDGSFTFLPGVGDKNQTDSFSYKVTDGEAQSTGTVQVGIVNELVWYVDKDAASNGDGRSTAPFNTLVNVSGAGGSGDADGQGDTLFLYSAASSYGGGLPLEASQDLIGEPEGLTVNNGSGNVGLVAPAGSNPVITNANPGGDGVVLANGVTMRRVSVANTSDDGITGSGVGSADIGPNLSVSGAAGVGFELLGGSGTVGFGGSVANSGARQVEVQNRTGGAVTLSGAVNGTGAGVLAQNNGGATVNFTSGSVQLNTGASDAFRATGGGTVNVTGANNTLATSGSGLFVQNTTIGAAGLNFKTITSNGGSNTGIVLDNTGSSGGLSVSGGGTAGSGGTIANKSGGDGSTTTGVGVYLNNTRSVSLSRMQLNDFENFAVRGTTVDGFTLANSVVSATSTAGDCTADNANGDSAALDEGSLSFTNLTGAASLAGSNISGACKDNLRVENSGGTLNRLVLNDTTIGANNTNQGNDGVTLEATGGVFNVTVENDSDFTSARGDLFQLEVVGNAQSDLDFTGNDLSNDHPAIAQGGGGVTIGAANSGDLTYDVTGNDLRDSLGTALAIGKGFGGAPGDGTATGKVESNVVGVSGVPNSGSEAGSGIEVGELARGSHTTLIKSNQVRGYSNFGILLSVGGAAETVTGLTHDGVMNAAVQGNTIAQPNAPSGGLAQNGIHANVGTNAGDDYQVCLGLGDPSDPGKRNTVNGSGALGGTDYRLRQRFDTDVRMPGYTGPANDPSATGALDTALTTYLAPRTNGPFTLSSSSTSTGGFFNTPGGAACPQP